MKSQLCDNRKFVLYTIKPNANQIVDNSKPEKNQNE